jgi:hypothetical protein
VKPAWVGRDFALVDPDGLIVEPDMTLGVILREDPVELLAEGAWLPAHCLARRCGLDVHVARPARQAARGEGRTSTATGWFTAHLAAANMNIQLALDDLQA